MNNQPSPPVPKFLLVSLVPPMKDKEAILPDLEELQSLVSTYGGVVEAVSVQRAEYADRATYVGSGKAQEIASLIETRRIDIVVINDIVKPGVLFTLKQIFFRANVHIEVWDRVDLILHIFSQHADTAEAKLQIKLAFMRHMGPRIYGLGMELSQQAGGIGTRGIGETNTELMLRHWRREIKQVKDKLTRITATKVRQLEYRKRHGIRTVSLVGYTNAGKTSLFNMLTGKQKLVADVLFATLDTSSGSAGFIKKENGLIFTDTIGFIRRLPPTLIKAFQSTLLESLHADVLLHVIDAADPHMYEKITSVETILSDLDADTVPRLYVFNKVDKVGKIANASILNKKEIQRRYGNFNPHFISVATGEGIEELKQTLCELL